MKFVLMKKCIWGVANGKEMKPSTRDDEVAWLVSDEKALDVKLP